VNSPVAVELADVVGVRHLEEAAPVCVDGVEIALPVVLVAPEGDLLPVRRPDRVEAPEGARIVEPAATGAGDRELPQAGSVGAPAGVLPRGLRRHDL
jgi:hypothetical protein